MKHPVASGALYHPDPLPQRSPLYSDPLSENPESIPAMPSLSCINFFITIAYSQSELRMCLQSHEVNMQIKPVFADLVTFIVNKIQ